MSWREFKIQSELKWQTKKIKKGLYGYQIAPETKWNKGLSDLEILSFEQKIGFNLPVDYKEMLKVINGFDRDSINVYGNDGHTYSYFRNCYKYPDDLNITKWLLEEIIENRQSVDEVLSEEGFDPAEVIGFIPIYGHRSMVVFNNLNLSPVISIVGSDVIIYGLDLMTYVRNEFHISVMTS